jgi:hypothetical protein
MPLKKGSWRKRGLRQTLPEKTLMTSEMIAATTTLYFLLVDLPFSCRTMQLYAVIKGDSHLERTENDIYMTYQNCSAIISKKYMKSG